MGFQWLLCTIIRSWDLFLKSTSQLVNLILKGLFRWLSPQKDRGFINQTLNWIVPEDNILYFSHSHSTYAKSSHGMNAYLTALDRDTNQIIWRSQPLVCNARNFIIIDSVIICGYGFTAEPDYLYLIDKYTGNILQQIKLKTAPEYIIPKDDKLYVRTYDTNYVFSIQQ